MNTLLTNQLMNTLQIWIHSAGAKALGWTLAHFVWEGAAIGGALAVALAMFRGSSARLRYGIACAALVAMPIAFGVTFAVSLPHSPTRTIIPIPLPEPLRVQFEDMPPAPPESWKFSSLVAWAAPLWLAGVTGLLLFRFVSWIAAQRLRRRGTCPAPEEWSRHVTSVAARLDISRPVALLQSCLAEVPIVIGYLRPVILVPIGLLAGLPVAQLEAILLHELAHIRRADYLVNLLQTTIESLLFYHPAAWWISSVVRAERENCCDDFVLARDIDPRAYAAALVALEEGRTGKLALAANGGNLLRRVRRILRKPAAQDVNLPIFPAALAILVAGIAFAAWQPDVVKPARSVMIPPPALVTDPQQRETLEAQPHLIAQAQTPTRPEAAIGGPPENLRSAQQEVEQLRVELERIRIGGRSENLRSAREQLEQVRIELEGMRTGSSFENLRSAREQLEHLGVELDRIRANNLRPAQEQLEQVRVELESARAENLRAAQEQLEQVRAEIEGVLAKYLVARAQQTQPMTDEQRAKQEQKLRQELESPYRKWLNEDVVYIITDAERKTFQALTTDFDREQFIEQFWKRRDPTPGTPENEYREEHYRRIAYSNEHFGSQSFDGWKTDRGRIYIMYGRPNELESHPSGGAVPGDATNTYPFELWRYRYIEALRNNITLEFVDSERNGEYHFTVYPEQKDVLLQVPNVPGALTSPGRHISVEVGPQRRVTFTIPLVGSAPYHVSGELRLANGTPAGSFDKTEESPKWSFLQAIVLQLGSYIFTATVNGIGYTATFEVK